jgi:hypothetical protein
MISNVVPEEPDDYTAEARLKTQYMVAVKRIFQYLKGTIDMQLTFRRELADLVGYSDSDRGGDPSIRRSTAGFIF